LSSAKINGKPVSTLEGLHETFMANLVIYETKSINVMKDP